MLGLSIVSLMPRRTSHIYVCALLRSWLSVPTMLLQPLEQVRVQRPRITHGKILADMLRLSHANDDGAHYGVRQDEAQRHFRQAHSVRKQRLQAIDSL